MRKPNILFILTDQHAHDCLSVMGHKIVETPNIDRLAAEGVLFRCAYTPSPVCAPARASIFSGMFPYPSGVTFNWVPFRGDTVLVTEHLQNAGYDTALVGKLHFVPHVKRFGFRYKKLHDAMYSIYADDDKYSDYVKWLKESSYRNRPDEVVRLADEDESAFRRGDWYRFWMGSNWRTDEEHSNTWVANESIEYLDRWRPADGPFFLNVSFFGPHQPFDPPEPWASRYRPEDIELPPQFYAEIENAPIYDARERARCEENKRTWDEGTFKKMLAAYFGQVAMIDHNIGRIFETLHRIGQWNDTLIVFASDHGDNNAAFGRFGKGNMYESSARVPLVVKPAPSLTTPRVVEKPVSTIDLFGTFCETAGVAGWKNGPVASASLVPFLERDETAVESNGEIYSIFGGDPQSSLTMLRKDHMKMVRLARGQDEPYYELFDMRDAVWDVRNVFCDEKYAAARDALRPRLDAFYSEQAGSFPKEVRLFSKSAKEK